MEKFIITALVLTVPAYFYCWLITRIDRFEKEPMRYLIAAFLWGALPAVILGIIFQLILGVPIQVAAGKNTLTAELLNAAISAPVTEEIFKGTAVAIIYLTRKREFDGWVDGIVYGGVAGIGFAYVENILYLTNLTTSWQEWFQLLILRTVVFGGLHGGWTALTGIGFGLARYQGNPLLKVILIAGGLLAAIIGHLIHNGAVTLAAVSDGATLLVALINYGTLILFMFLLWLGAGINDRKKLQTYLQDEVPAIISPEFYDGLCYPHSGKLEQLGLTKPKKRLLLHVAMELVQKK